MNRKNENSIEAHSTAEETPQLSGISRLLDVVKEAVGKITPKDHRGHGMISYVFRPFLSFSIWWALAILSLSIVLALTLYMQLQTKRQEALFHAALNADPITTICSGEPSMQQVNCSVDGEGGKRAGFSDHFIWSILTDANVLSTTLVETPVDLETATETPDIAAIIQFLRSESRRGETGLELVVGLTWGVCRSGTSHTKESLEALTHSLAYYIAGLQNLDEPDARAFEDPENFKRFIKRPLFNVTDGLMPPKNRVTATPMRISFARGVTDDEILTALLAKAGVIAPAGGERMLGYPIDTTVDSGCNFKSLKDAADRFRALAHFEKLALYTMGKIRRSDDFRDARAALTVVTGPEQMAIFIIAVFGILLAALRIAGALALRRDIIGGPGIGDRSHSFRIERLTTEMASARWPLRLAIGILPAIGFIGTVRGIMNSLAGADGIVWAASTSERAQAISTLAGELGLAFATTMLALIFGVILSVMSAIELRILDHRVLEVFRGTVDAE